MINPKLLEPTLLWENPNKNSSLGETEISVANLSDYKKFIVVWSSYKSSNSTAQYTISEFLYDSAIDSYTNMSYVGDDYTVIRGIKFVNNKINIAQAVLINLTNLSTSNDNQRVKPIYIYGSKYL